MLEVLIISDKSIIVNKIAEFCENNGGIVLHLTSGEEALEIIQKQKFDLLISSFAIEKLSGIQLIKFIKNTKSLNLKTPIVLLTSNKERLLNFPQSLAPDEIILKDQDTLVNFESYFRANLFPKKIKVLYVEDDKMAQKIVKKKLDKTDMFKSDICSSVTELRDKVENSVEKSYDLIISDNVLGDGDCYDVINLVEKSQLKDIPFIIFTASPEKLKLEELQKLGNVITILAKPFDSSVFLEIVSTINFNTPS